MEEASFKALVLPVHLASHSEVTATLHCIASFAPLGYYLLCESDVQRQPPSNLIRTRPRTMPRTMPRTRTRTPGSGDG